MVFDGSKAKKFHAAADIFPMLSASDLRILADDIKQNGLREPIYTYRDEIIDGRNRYKACQMAGVDPTYVAWDGVGSLVAFVMSLNLHRRHLDASQRAMAAVKARKAMDAEFLSSDTKRAEAKRLKEKQGKSLEHSEKDDFGQLAKTQNDDALPTDLAPEGFAAEEMSSDKNKAPSKAEREAIVVEQFNTSHNSMERAEAVLDAGSPELVEAVEAGDVTVADAAKILEQPAAVQAEAVKKVKAGKSRTAAKAVEEITAPEQEEPEGKTRVARLTDSKGKHVPAALREVFDHAKEFNIVGRKIDELRREIQTLAEHVSGFYLARESQSIIRELKDLKYRVTHHAPYALVPATDKTPAWASEIVFRGLTGDEAGKVDAEPEEHDESDGFAKAA